MAEAFIILGGCLWLSLMIPAYKLAMMQHDILVRLLGAPGRFIRKAHDQEVATMAKQRKEDHEQII